MAVDEKFVKRMADFTDWSDGAVGKQVRVTGHERDGIMGMFTISGVYKSYLIGNLQSVDSRPSALFYGEIGSKSSYMPHIFFKLSDGAALDKVREAVSGTLEGKDIEIVSYSELMRSAYDDSRKMRSTLALGAAFSLLIALLGLTGFTRDETLRRSKEMAVRKINGATTRDILGIFARSIMSLSLVMSAIACAGAFFTARRWLESFAQKATLAPQYFLAGAAAVLLIVLAVVVLNCYRIATANPVDSLKNE